MQGVQGSSWSRMDHFQRWRAEWGREPCDRTRGTQCNSTLYALHVLVLHTQDCVDSTGKTRSQCQALVNKQCALETWQSLIAAGFIILLLVVPLCMAFFCCCSTPPAPEPCDADVSRGPCQQGVEPSSSSGSAHAQLTPPRANAPQGPYHIVMVPHVPVAPVAPPAARQAYLHDWQAAGELLSCSSRDAFCCSAQHAHTHTPVCAMLRCLAAPCRVGAAADADAGTRGGRGTAHGPVGVSLQAPSASPVCRSSAACGGAAGKRRRTGFAAAAGAGPARGGQAAVAGRVRGGAGRGGRACDKGVAPPPPLD